MGDVCTVQNRFNIVITGNQIQISHETGLISLFCRNQMRGESAIVKNVLALQKTLWFYAVQCLKFVQYHAM